MKKTIKIKFVDFGKNFNYKDFYIYQTLIEKYNIVICDNPDYIIYSCFGYEYLKYNCIRIFYCGENFRPNFNQCDYAIGFDYINFEDRYLRAPLYLLFDMYMERFNIATKKNLDEDNYIIRNKFCNMVVSNGLYSKRINFFKELSKYRQVDSGGRLLNNVGSPVKSKLDFQKKYKFSLAFENSVSNGYTTEKIIDAFAAGGIPIYWGDPTIEKTFNKKSFINANNFTSDKDLIDYIKKVDNNDNLFLSYIKEPILNSKNYLQEEYKKINNFVYNIFDQEVNKAKRISYSIQYEQERKSLLIVSRLIKFSKPLISIKNKLFH